MKTTGCMGPGPQIIVAIKDGPMVRVFTGIVRDGSIMVHSVPTGRRTVKLEVEFDLDYQGAQMKTWADIKKPEEISASQPDIEAD